MRASRLAATDGADFQFHQRRRRQTVLHLVRAIPAAHSAQPPKRLFDKYAAKVDSPHIARYYAMVEWFDETVGELVNHIDEKGSARTRSLFM